MIDVPAYHQESDKSKNNVVRADCDIKLNENRTASVKSISLLKFFIEVTFKQHSALQTEQLSEELAASSLTSFFYSQTEWNQLCVLERSLLLLFRLLLPSKSDGSWSSSGHRSLLPSR